MATTTITTRVSSPGAPSWLHQATGQVASFLNDQEAGGAGPSLWLDLGSQWRTHGRYADGNEADDHDSEGALRRAWLATAIAHRAHNQASVWLCALPEELQLLVLSHLDHTDLAALSLVSTLFHRIACDNMLWQLQFERAQHAWKVACNVGAEPLPSGAGLTRWFEEKLSATHSALSQLLHQRKATNADVLLSAEQTAPVDWKSLYRVHYSESARHVKPTKSKTEVVLTRFGAAPSASPLSFLPKSIRTALQRNQVFRVPMFGRGLDLSAKKLLYNVIWSLDSPYPVCALHPGSGGIGSGVGLSCEGKELNLTAIYEEEGVFDKLRPAWQVFVQGSSGLIMVMDNRRDGDSLTSAKRELTRFVSYDGEQEPTVGEPLLKNLESCDDERPLAVTRIPLLIFLCEAGAKDDADTLTPSQVALEFELATRMRGRKWCVRQVCPDSLQGIAEGLHWLASNL